MKELQFKKMDAFTRGSSSGNPAGCIYLEHEAVLKELEMQQIAKELKGFVNEVGFLRVEQDGYGLKFYSSECAVKFCGHATIGIMYELIKNNAQLMKQEEIPLYVNEERLLVFNKIKEEDAVYIMAPIPKELDCSLTVDEIANALGTPKNNVDETISLEVIDGGLRTLLVPIISLNSCLSILPQQETLRQFCEANDIDIILVFCKETYLSSSDFRTRVFAPRFGYLEDPATGSGNSAFGHYLIKHNLWKNHITIEQGMSRECPNIVKLRNHHVKQTERILFGGSSILRICGKYVLHG